MEKLPFPCFLCGNVSEIGSHDPGSFLTGQIFSARERNSILKNPCATVREACGETLQVQLIGEMKKSTESREI